MELIGTNKLVLTPATVMRLLEDAINASQRDGENYIRVTDISRSYSYGDFTIEVTTESVQPVELQRAA